MFADKEIAICLWDLKEFQYGFGLHSLVLFFKLIHKPQVEESKRKDLYLNKFWRIQAVWKRLVRWVSVGIFSYKVWLEGYLWNTSSGINSIVGVS